MTVYRRDKALGTVVRSINEDGGSLCVDFFHRRDGSFGFEEYRRDAESGEGWFPVGFHSERKFETLAVAESAASNAVAWLEADQGERDGL